MHWYSCSPVCILIWQVRLHLSMKILSQWTDMVSLQCVSSLLLSFFFILQESLITLVALIRLLFCVFSHIKYKFIILCKRLVTFATIIRFFYSVYYKMPYDLIFLWEMLVTMVTVVWFFSSVSHVCFKMSKSYKNLITMAALICYFPMCIFR